MAISSLGHAQHFVPTGALQNKLGESSAIELWHCVLVKVAEDLEWIRDLDDQPMTL